MPFSDWFRRRRGGERLPPSAPVPQPGELLVLECRECGKVFDSVSRRSPCPECDSDDVEVLSG